MSHAVWEAYLALLNTMTVATALVILISTADDFFLDAFYWVRELWLWRSASRLPATISAQTLREREERYLAIMVPAWKEYDVIAKMVENTLATMEYTRYIIFAGAYRNDAETTTEVDRMVRRYPGRVVRATVAHDGPTCKADCLNTIVQTIVRYEAGHGIRFAGVIMHDCEDVIHPLELKYFNYFIGDQDLVQLPVLSLERKWYEWVAGTYMDDFSETHQKDLVAREALTGTVPGAGVALCYSRRAIEAVMKVRGDAPFNTGTLTEDYDFSFRLHEPGHARGVRALSDLRERGAGRRCERQAAHALARGAPARRAAAVAGHPRIFSEHLPHRVSAARAGSWASPSRAGCRWGGTAT